MMDRFPYIQEPGHGWIAVSKDDLAKLGLSEADFSKYSYRSKDHEVLFLEEDMDALVFLRRYKEKTGRDALLSESFVKGDCYVRRLPRVGE